MLDILTFDLDDMGAGGAKLLAILAVVLAAILVVMLRDLFLSFEALGQQEDEVADGDADVEDSAELPDSAASSAVEPAKPFVDRRNPANPVTGFGRRKGDVEMAPRQHAA
jgi:hypothetical protein